MSELEKFICVGIVFPTLDGPGIGTPVFRKADGERFYIQSFKKKGIIEDFVFVGELRYQKISIYLSNMEIGVGDPPQYALASPDGDIIVDKRSKICAEFIENRARFSEFPFLFYQMAILARDHKLIIKAFKMPIVRDAVASRAIPVIFPRVPSRSFQLSKLELELSYILISCGYNTGEIARILSTSVERLKPQLHVTSIKYG